MPLEELDLIRFFREGFNLLIKIQTKQKRQKLDIYKEIIEKVVEVKAITGLQPTSYIREIDYQYQQENCRMYATAAEVQTQKKLIKNSKNKKTKRKILNSQASNLNNESSSMKAPEKTQKKKKKKYLRKKRDKKKVLDFTLAMKMKIINSNPIDGIKRKNFSQIISYNNNKKSHFLQDCTKAKKDPKTSINLGNLYVSQKT